MTETLLDVLAHNKDLYVQNAQEFQLTFGRKLSDFWTNHLLGFDIVKFDEEFLKTPYGKSPAMQVEQEYGSRAVKLIEILIDFEEDNVENQEPSNTNIEDGV